MFCPPKPREKSGMKVILAIRPEGAAIAGPDRLNAGFPRLEGVVQSRVFTGQTYRVELVERRGPTLLFDLPNAPPPPPPGKRIDLTIDPSSVVIIFPEEVNSK